MNNVDNKRFADPFADPFADLFDKKISPTEKKQGEIRTKIEQKASLSRYILLTGGLILIGAFFTEILFLIQELAQETFSKSNFNILENQATKPFNADFIEKIKSIHTKTVDQHRLIKRLALSTQDEKQIFKYLETTFVITTDNFAEILKGAHVRLDDDGMTYNHWEINIVEKTSRGSSHPSDAHTKQYGIRGKIVKELLFSQITENENAFTWFQLENHPTSIGYLFRHMLDYVKYKCTGCNQGPEGSSKYTHENPLVLKLKINSIDLES